MFIFILKLLTYIGIGFLVAFLYRKYKINVIPNLYYMPMEKPEIGLTVFLWPLLVWCSVVAYFVYYITLPFRRLLRFLIDIVYSHTK